MAPPIASARNDRGRWACRGRARETLAEAFVEDDQDPAQVLQRRLRRVIREAKQQVIEDAPMWSTISGTRQLKLPHRYFGDFVEQVLQTINRYGEHEIHQRVSEYKQRLDQNTHDFLREADVYNERLVAGAKPSRMKDRKCKEQELYLYEPLQYWEKNQQVVMRRIIDERLRRIIPNIGEFHQEEAEEEEEESEHGEMCDEERQRLRDIRKRRTEMMKEAQEHDKAMTKAAQDAKSLERQNEELREQLEAMAKSVAAAEAERERLRALKAKIEQEIESKGGRRSSEIERQQKLAEQRQRELKEANGAAAATAAAEKQAAAATAATAAKLGETLLTYTWAEHLEKPIADELESERVRLGISKEEWKDRVLVLNKYGQEVKLSKTIPPSENIFSLTVVFKHPRGNNVEIKRVVKQGEKPTPKPLDKAELARLVQEALAASEAEQAAERAQLQARIRELEAAIAELQNMSGSDDEGSTHKDASKRKTSSQPEEEPPSDSVLKKLADTIKAPPKVKLAGEVKIVKSKTKVYKTRGVFERMHAEAADRVAKDCQTKLSAEAATTGQFRLIEESTVAKPCAQLSVAAALMPREQKKKKKEEEERKKREEENYSSNASRNSDPKRNAKRPSSSGTIGIQSKQGSRAAAQKLAQTQGFLKAGWSPGARSTNDPVSSGPPGPMTLESVMQRRGPSELGRLQGGWQLQDDVSASRDDLDKFFQHRRRAGSGDDGTGDFASRTGLLDEAGAGTQWGSSVLHNRIPAELAGPSRMRLLHQVFDQHLQDGAEDCP